MSTEKRFESDPSGTATRLPSTTTITFPSGSTNASGELKVELQGTSESVPVHGTMLFSNTPSVIRPADTAPYTAGDEISNDTDQADADYLEFSGVTRDGISGNGYIVKARLTKTNNNVTNATFRLYLFSVPPTMVGDNAPFVVSTGEILVGWFDFTFSTLGVYVAIGQSSGDGGPMAFNAPNGSLYGVLVATGAYTPASGETFTPELTIDPN